MKLLSIKELIQLTRLSKRHGKCTTCKYLTDGGGCNVWEDIYKADICFSGELWKDNNETHST